MKKTLILTLLFCFLMSSVAFAGPKKVVSLGYNLTESQKSQMLDKFGVDKNDVQIITVTNDEERQYLQNIAPSDKIGTRSISCAMVEQLDPGKGLIVETDNLNWVTKDMIINSLATAGVKDASITAAAPFSVSGTAALTGITKAFEVMSGKKLSTDAKKTANQELVDTGKLGDQIGKDKATILVKDLKDKVIANKIKDPDQIKSIINDTAKKLNITLTDEQIKELVDLLQKIGNLNINIGDINKQLNNISSQLKNMGITQQQTKNIVQQILNALQSFFTWVRNLFAGK